MTLALLVVLATVLTVAAAREALADGGGAGRLVERLLESSNTRRAQRLALAATRLGIRERLVRAGLADRVGIGSVLACKATGALAGAAVAVLAAPSAPGRLSILVAAGMPAAGFLAPDAWLERAGRRRLARLRGALPDALELLAVGAASGRSPLAGFAELARGEGPLARELGVAVSETSTGAPQREALASLRRRVPTAEVAALCALIERSHRHGSPLADQLQSQAVSLRQASRRRIEEQAARAAPKIQLAVALLLVPSVLLMIVAALLANVDRFLAGL
jgi:tight adherence protein C